MSFQSSPERIEEIRERAASVAGLAKCMEDAIKPVCEAVGCQAANDVWAAGHAQQLTTFQLFMAAIGVGAPIIEDAFQSLPFETLMDALRKGCMRQLNELYRGQTDGGSE
ncbi:hypothetical protein [Rhodoblastus sp.]|uniref:hypothetical protein n=1 Tax=Rhodoblastus sp. TaxID=1962975 RepID=UPI0035AF7B34